MNAEHHSQADPGAQRWMETLRDHSRVLIRPMRHTDRNAERAFVESLPLDDARFRAFGCRGVPEEPLVDWLTDIDCTHEFAFVAVVREDSHERMVGACRYRTDAAHLRCECTVEVAPGWRDRGLATSLMRRLITMARQRGIRRMFAEANEEDLAVRDLMRFLGFQSHRHEDRPGRVAYDLDLAPDEPPATD